MKKIAVCAGLAAVLMLSACTESEDIKVTETLTEQLTEETSALTETVTEMPVEFEGHDYGVYYMPESGDYIALVKPPCYESMDSEIYVIAPDTAEVSHKYTIPAEAGNLTSFFFSGNDKLCASDGQKLVIMDMDL